MPSHPPAVAAPPATGLPSPSSAATAPPAPPPVPSNEEVVTKLLYSLNIGEGHYEPQVVALLAEYMRSKSPIKAYCPPPVPMSHAAAMTSIDIAQALHQLS